MSDSKKKAPAAGRDAGKAKPAPRKRSPRSRKQAEAAAVTDNAVTAQPAVSNATANAVAAQAPAVQPALIRIPLSVRWRDLDAFNHVNNSQFLSYLEEARLRWMVT
ncbi:acyl-CoA thioesterase, partial [Lysobacter sp. 2RAB21]